MARYIVDYIDEDGNEDSTEIAVEDGETTADAEEKARGELTARCPSIDTDEWEVTKVREVPPFRNRLDAVVTFLGERFSCGSMSVSVDDEMDDGVLLSDEIEGIIEDARRQTAGQRPAVLDALRTLTDTWRGGYDLASGEDYATDDDTVADLVEAHLAPTKASAPS